MEDSLDTDNTRQRMEGVLKFLLFWKKVVNGAVIFLF